MKKLVVLVLTLGWLVSNGQREPILPYGNYSPKEVKEFANGDSPKAKKFSLYLLHKTGESNIDSLFQKVVVIDTLLEAGSYDNSCWDVQAQELKFFLGKRFKGEVTLYRNKIFETILYKDTCVNILNTPRKYFGLIDDDQPIPVINSLPSQTTTIYNLNFNVTIADKKTPDLHFPPAPKEHKKIKVGKIILIGGGSGLLATAIAVVVKALLGNHHHDLIVQDVPGGVPGGAPLTKPTVPPVVPPVPPSGGPGGAPLTK